jgi:hypothetical protein
MAYWITSVVNCGTTRVPKGLPYLCTFHTHTFEQACTELPPKAPHPVTVWNGRQEIDTCSVFVHIAILIFSDYMIIAV